MTVSHILYVDGACLGNPGIGGWGAVHFAPHPLESGSHQPPTHFSGNHEYTTNNIMELTAAIKGLEQTPKGARVSLHTDSQYVCKGMQGWLEGWKKNGWRSATKKPVANKELWQALDAVASERDVKFIWVKGHAGNEFNEVADKLASNAAASLRDVAKKE